MIPEEAVKIRTKAMLSSPGGFEQHGSTTEHKCYAMPVNTRRRCRCGCKGRQTHSGMANGLAMTGGCHISVLRWAKERNTARAVTERGGE